MKVLKFSAEWCGPCKAYATVFEEVTKMEEFKDVEFVNLDVEDADDLVNEYKISSVPTTVIISKGKVNKIIGSVSEGELVKRLKMYA